MSILNVQFFGGLNVDTKLQVKHSTELRILPSKASETILRNFMKELVDPSTDAFRGDGDLVE